MNVLLINPGETPKVTTIDGSLKSMRELVGGMIQAVYPFSDPVALVCNDVGKLLGMAPNRALRHPDTGEVYDIICGPFFLCGLGDENFDSLSEELIKKYEEVFRYPKLFIPSKPRPNRLYPNGTSKWGSKACQ